MTYLKRHLTSRGLLTRVPIRSATGHASGLYLWLHVADLGRLRMVEVRSDPTLSVR